MAPREPKITFRPQEGGGYVVYHDGDRLGLVREIERSKWAAVDTYFVPAGNSHKTRAKAVKALLRRHAKETA